MCISRLAVPPSRATRLLLLASMLAMPGIVRAVPIGYVAHGDGFVLGGKVSVLDSRRPTTFRRPSADVSFPAGVEPWWMALSPDGSKLYVTDRRQDIDYSPGDVLVIDTASNAVTATIPVGSFAGEVAVHPAGTFVYVSNRGDDTVSVIDTGTNTVVTTVPVPDAPGGLVVDPTGAHLFVG